MPRKAALSFSEKELSKGERRKLTALRKSIGEELGNRAFGDWYKTRDVGSAGTEDKNKDVIVAALEPLIKANKLKIPRGGYLLRRGRRRVILERPAS